MGLQLSTGLALAPRQILGVSVPANPSEIITSTANYAWWQAGETQAYSDLGTTPVETDGSSVRQHDAGTGSLASYERTTASGQEPTLQTRDGIRVIRYDGVNDYLEKAFSQAQPITIVAIGYNQSGTVHRIVESTGSADATRMNLVVEVGGNLTIFAEPSGTAPGNGTPVIPAPATGFFCMSVVYDGNDTTFQINGGQRVRVGSPGANPSGGVRTGADNSATPANFSAYDEVALVVAHAALTDDELDDLMTWGLSQINVDAPTVDTHAFLVAGQSNSTAREPFDSGDDYPTDGTILQVARSGAPLTSNTDEAIINAVRPLDHWSQPQAGGMGFALQFALDYRAANPDVNLLLVPAGNGGTGFFINDWNEGDTEFSDAWQRVNKAMADNETFEFKGVLWHQGEADSLSSSAANAYQTSFDAAVPAMRGYLPNAETLPWIVGELVPDWITSDPLHDQVNEIIVDTPNRLPYTALVVNDGTDDQGDNLHYNTASHRILGSRYYSALATAMANTPRVPDAPKALSGSPGDGQVELSWTAPEFTGFQAITDYIVEFSSNGGTSWSTFSDGVSTATSATVTGLTNETEYTFRVSAVNASGTGAASATTTSTPTDVFSPGNVSDLVFWHKSTEGVTGSPSVTQWNDLSGNANHATQSTGSLQFTTGSNTLNSKNVLTGASDLMETASVDIDMGACTLIVIGTPAATGNLCMFGQDEGGGGQRTFQMRVDSEDSFRIVIFESDNSLLVNPALTGATGEHFFAMRCKATEVDQYLGTSAAPTNTSYGGGTGASRTATTLFIGDRDTPATSEAYSGDIAEVLFYSRALTDGEMAQIRTYAATEWAA